MALTEEDIKKISHKIVAKIRNGLVGCKCIDPELAAVLESAIERERADAKSHIAEPYGDPMEASSYYRERIERLNAAEDALKSQELCD